MWRRSYIWAALFSVALLVGGTASAEAIIGGQTLRAPYETEVSPEDAIMACQGPRLPTTYNYDCHYYSSEVTESQLIHLAAEKVTDDVAGCVPGTQPVVSKAMYYSRTSGFMFGGSVKIDLKVLSGFSGLMSKLKEFGPGVQGNFGYSVSTTFGEAKTYGIPSNYGKISWGIFSQDALESKINQSVQITSTDIQGPRPMYYTAHGVTVVTPIADNTTNFPQGVLAKTERNFGNVEEFNTLCPGGVLPDYLGGPGKPVY